MLITADQLRDTAAIASPLVAIIAVSVAAASFRTSRLSFLQGRTGLVTQVRSEWVALHSEWAIVRALKSGPQDYYCEATPAQRQELREVAQTVSKLFEECGFAADYHAPLQEYKNSLTRINEFLDTCAHLVLSRRITVRDAYAILGPDVTRQGGTIRWMLGIGDSTWWDEELPANLRHGHDWLYPLIDSTSHARQERILALVDLLWAEACRCGDREAHIMMQIAEHKQRASGATNRRRIRRLTKQLSNQWTSIRLQRHLLFGEYLPISSVHQNGKRIVTDIDRKTLRIGLWRVYATISWLRSYFSLPLNIVIRIRIHKKKKNPLSD